MKQLFAITIIASFFIACSGSSNAPDQESSSGTAGISDAGSAGTVSGSNKGGSDAGSTSQEAGSSGSSGEAGMASSEGGEASSEGGSQSEGGASSSSAGTTSSSEGGSITDGGETSEAGSSGIAGNDQSEGGSIAEAGGDGIAGTETVHTGGDQGVAGSFGEGGEVSSNGGNQNEAGSSMISEGGSITDGGATACAQAEESCVDLPCCSSTRCDERQICIPLIGNGGVSGNGGATSSGGSTGIGGATSQGGLTGNGGMGNGGLTGNGGVTGSGGSGVGGLTGNGGASSQGGATNIGGNTNIGGDTNVGGTSVCDPIPLSFSAGGDVQEPMTCTTPVRDESYDNYHQGQWRATSDVLALPNGERYVAVANTQFAHYSPDTGWETINVSLSQYMTIDGSPEKGIWAGGSSLTKDAFAMRLEDGEWVDRSDGLPVGPFPKSMRDVYVVSLDEAYAIVEGSFMGDYRARIYRWDGSTWSDMNAPRADEELELSQIWGDGSSAFVVAGGAYGPRLFRWSGCSWTDYSDSLPSDVQQIRSVSGNSNGVTATGIDGSTTVGFVIHSSDLVHWMVQTFDGFSGEGIIALRPGTIVVGGGPMETAGTWDGRLSIGSEAVLPVPASFDEYGGVTGAFSATGSTVWMATSGSANDVEWRLATGLYSMTCQ